MSDTKESSLTQEVIDRLNVVTLPGAAALKEDELLLEVTYALRALEKMGDPFTSKVAHWGSSPYAAVIVETGDHYTLYIGLGLEVIQAMQQHEKK